MALLMQQALFDSSSYIAYPFFAIPGIFIFVGTYASEVRPDRSPLGQLHFPTYIVRCMPGTA
jgi:hypothetical protein